MYPCSFCRDTILQARTSWGYHHADHHLLQKSARRQCAFCTVLLEDVEQRRSALDGFCVSDTSQEQTVKQWLHGYSKQTEKLLPTPVSLPSLPSSLYRWSIRSLGRTREGKLMIAITFRVIPRTLVTGDDTPSSNEAQTFGLPERIFYCFPESDLRPLLVPANLGASTNPDASDGFQIKRWIRDCGIHHKNCPKRAGASSKWVPTRLLHVGGRRAGESIRVVQTKLENTKGPYVTLSHCWGPSPEARLDTLTEESWEVFTKSGVPWSYLCKNFQQAIEVTRFLEVDYIWIDSLCVIQGDREDWKYEGSLMHKVYRNSYCNIAAADAEDSKSGLFRKRNPQDVIPAYFETDGSSALLGKQRWRIVREDLWNSDLLSRPLYKRGWVFQERMLAPRILHFSRRQIFWDCAEMSACESLPAGLPLPLDREASVDRHWRGRLQESGSNMSLLLSAANDDSPEDFWRAAVENYTSLDLTKQSDKNLAVWGIAKLVRDIIDEEFMAGLWEFALEEQLAWRVADCVEAQRPKELTENPTWSWTSIHGKILLQDRLRQHERIYRVKDHLNQPLSFKEMDNKARSKNVQNSPGNREEVLANMGRDLQLVEERRNKSNSSSRRNSQTGAATPTQNALISAGRANSDKGMLFEYEQISLRGLKREQSQGKDSAEDLSSGKDEEPKLLNKQLAIQGYIHQGILHAPNATKGWTIRPSVLPDFAEETSVIIEAFPDTLENAQAGLSLFVILALTQYPKRYSDMKLPRKISAPDSKSWYEGCGIMLRPSTTDRCYFRTGALIISHLSSKMWQYIQTANNPQTDSASEHGTWEGAKFFII